MFSYGIVKGLLLRAFGYVVSFLLIIFLFVFVPDRSLPVMRDVGTRTMPPYLLHTYVIMFMRTLYALLFTAVPQLNQWYVTIPIAVIVAVAVMSVLGMPVFNSWYGALMNWIKKLLYREPMNAQ